MTRALLHRPASYKHWHLENLERLTFETNGKWFDVGGLQQIQIEIGFNPCTRDKGLQNGLALHLRAWKKTAAGGNSLLRICMTLLCGVTIAIRRSGAVGAIENLFVQTRGRLILRRKGRSRASLVQLEVIDSLGTKGKTQRCNAARNWCDWLMWIKVEAKTSCMTLGNGVQITWMTFISLA